MNEVCGGYSGCSASGHTTHGYEAHAGASYWGMEGGNECTNYAAYVESAVYGAPTPAYNLGDADAWAVNAAAHGVTVNDVPSVGAVAEWNGGEPGLPLPGHVAVVEAVGPDDSYIVVSQQHMEVADGYDWELIRAGSQAWESWPDQFIHFHPYKAAVAVTPTPGGAGYWVADNDGGVFAHGTAQVYGSVGDLRLNAPISGMAATPDGRGYWLVAADGGIFSFGDAEFYGPAGALHLNAPIVDIVATPDGRGYWLVGSDGGIFNFGDAGFYASTGHLHLNSPIVGMARTPDGRGYWLVGGDGGIFSFGDAAFHGSTGTLHLKFSDRRHRGIVRWPWLLARGRGRRDLQLRRRRLLRIARATSPEPTDCRHHTQLGGQWLPGRGRRRERLPVLRSPSAWYRVLCSRFILGPHQTLSAVSPTSARSNPMRSMSGCNPATSNP